jgi:hypothetical protein
MKFPLLRLPALAGLGAAILLAGCNQQVVVMCPSAAILADTASETVFRPGAPQDPSGEAYTAAVTDVKTDCTFDRQQGETFSSLDISFRATRAPSPDAARYQLVYFVSINSGDRVINKKQYSVRFDFAPGSTTATADASPDRTIINLERGLLPTDYQLLTGFQLTADQLAYNRKMGRYVP